MWNSNLWPNSSITKQNEIRRRRSTPISANAYLAPAFNACADCPESIVDSPLLRYTRSRRFPSSSSPTAYSRDTDAARLLRQLYELRLGLSSLSSSTSTSSSPIRRSSRLYNTPAKLEEDVLVMDGILLKESSGSNRTITSASEVGSYSSSNNTSNTSGDGLYASGFRSKAQFPHGKDDLQVQRLPLPQKQEGRVQISDKCVVTQPACTNTNGIKQLPVLRAASSAATADATVKSMENKTALARPPLPSTSSSFPDWLLTEEELNVNEVLGWNTPHRRLPVFQEICPDADE